jgi:predicted porin
MNKKLLVAAIAAAATLPMAAQAGVQIYGVIHASIDYVDPYNAGDDDFIENPLNNDGDSFWNVSSNTSRIGFKGSEDLGNGLKAIWKVEQGVNIANGGGSWATRNSYIGLAGDWGTFLYGRHDTPYKISTGKLDLFADRMADYNTTIGFQDVRANDAIAYISPNMSGFTVAAALVPGYDYAAGNNGLADGYSLAAMYSNNGLFAALAYEDLKKLGARLTNSDGDSFIYDGKNNKWRAGLGWFGDSFSVGGLYERQNFEPGSVDRWQISGQYMFGNSAVKAMWGQEDPDDTGKRSAWAIGYDYKLSKRTTAYALYTDANDKDYANIVPGEDGLVTGSRGLHNYNFPGKGISLGAIHKF